MDYQYACYSACILMSLSPVKPGPNVAHAFQEKTGTYFIFLLIYILRLRNSKSGEYK